MNSVDPSLTTEHYFHYYGGAVPNPAVILAAWARETKYSPRSGGIARSCGSTQGCRGLCAGRSSSGGRCDMGVAKGFVPHEFDVFT